MGALNVSWVDLIFVVTVFYFVLTNRGFVLTAVEIFGFLFSLFVSYSLYGTIAPFYVKTFSIPLGFAHVLGFFSGWFLSELLFQLLSFFILKKFALRKIRPWFDHGLGAFLGAVQAGIVFLFFTSLVFALPVRGQVKQAILSSQSGPFFVDLSRSFESRLKEVFGQAANETLNFLTVKPESTSTVSLGFTADPAEVTFDAQSESVMTGLVNQERIKEGRRALGFDTELRAVARAYAKEMLVHGFFSHTSAVDGSNAAARASRAGIVFGVLGENLAFAPDVYLAHQGLMNSPGHRKNILSPDYQKIGIGVADAGVLGKTFVQLFSD